MNHRPGPVMCVICGWVARLRRQLVDTVAPDGKTLPLASQASAGGGLAGFLRSEAVPLHVRIQTGPASSFTGSRVVSS